MPDDNTAQRMDDAIESIQDVKALIDELYHNPQVATLSNKPVLSMLSTAADYLTVNLSQIRRAYMHETGE